MKLATKLISVFLLVILVLIALSAYLEVERESERYVRTMRADLEHVSHYIQHVFAVHGDGVGDDKPSHSFEAVPRSVGCAVG